ncbi:426_t:CDS:2 [Dentiscutata heterogama]|uniref:426_t:CDS:1 n=1 Tax=Dentiscutata heterogama TaxID=1316150 RepID=A0ACA9K0M6_9GLOM|nr:426_t:CDS:2 [Dentiscutata heterogama]
MKILITFICFAILAIFTYIPPADSRNVILKAPDPYLPTTVDIFSSPVATSIPVYPTETKKCEKEGHEKKGHEKKGHEKKGHEKKGHEEKGHEKKGHEEKGHEKKLRSSKKLLKHYKP